MSDEAYVPGLQVRQNDDELAPVKGPYEPEPHEVHADVPVVTAL